MRHQSKACCILLAAALALSSCKNGESQAGKGMQQPKKDTVAWAAPQKYAHMRPLVERSLQEVNRLLPDSCKTSEVKVVEGAAPDYAGSWTVFYTPYPSPTIVLGSSFLSDSALAKLVIFHEQSHAFFDFSAPQEAKSRMERLFLQAMGSKKPSASQDIALEKEHPIFPLFDESSYCKGKSPQLGHPYDGASELFASASAVLRFFPSEFLSRLRRLEQEDKSASKTAKEIARAVLEIWKGSNVLSLPELE
ncbi:MAG: hypothetical protein N3F07_01885 [Candidatus Micrarchaeota archaeon]|nr:hypothetical protein [Candidatus Micrarchaeota archaeon]